MDVPRPAPDLTAPNGLKPGRNALSRTTRREHSDASSARERGALLRQEGLYHSRIEYWRETLQKASLTALSDG